MEGSSTITFRCEKNADNPHQPSYNQKLTLKRTGGQKKTTPEKPSAILSLKSGLFFKQQALQGTLYLFSPSCSVRQEYCTGPPHCNNWAMKQSISCFWFVFLKINMLIYKPLFVWRGKQCPKRLTLNSAPNPDSTPKNCFLLEVTLSLAPLSPKSTTCS